MNIDAKLAQSCRPQKAGKNHAIEASVTLPHPPLLGNNHNLAYVSVIDGAASATSQRVRVPRGRDGLLLYVDFDGVLHHENTLWHPKTGPYLCAPSRYVLFQHCDLLSEVLAPYPEVQIVLSTSWVLQYGFKNSLKRLPVSLQERAIGATYHSRHMRKEYFRLMPRGEQVADDVNRRRPRAWLALDDNYEGWTAEHKKNNWIQTEPYEGLSDPDVLSLFKTRLEAMCKTYKSK